MKRFLLATYLSAFTFFFVSAQTKIKDGTISSSSLPHPSAVLELESKNKGFLPPRLSLTSRTDIVTIPNPAVGTFIYNLGAEATFPYVGYVYWNGTEWLALNNSTLKPGTISSLMCGDALLSPNTYTTGSPYTGTLTVPYIGGNGGTYPSQTITTTNGLTVTLESGNFNYGAGSLTYTVTGTPTTTSPVTTNIPISIGSQSCTATVGNGNALKVGESISAYYSVPVATASVSTFNLKTYVTANNLTPLPLIDGLEMNLQGVSTTHYDARIYNRATSSQLVSYQTFATQVNQNETLLNQNVATNDFLQVDADNLVLWTTTQAEVVTTNVQVQVTPTVYRWYEFKWWCMEVSGTKKIFLSATRKG
ncbi:hypothetical protein [Polluticaenibacter yanchengensis]|uniref:Uncharacterized protein n=1 Tax=Polluticaenibacter yanchengensis TaxID=3014562 RepID=A0ABT4UGD4_9BACT|nr:hypothetical protein [Chitinophagaceae bacterium LY-5]